MYLVKPDSKQTDLEQTKLKQEIVESIVKGECTLPEDITNKFGISYEQTIHLFSDPNFTNLISKYSQAKLNLHFHSKTVNKISELSESEDAKIALQAIKLEAQLTQNLKGVGNTTDVNINFNLESLVKESEKSVNFINVESKKVG